MLAFRDGVIADTFTGRSLKQPFGSGSNEFFPRSSILMVDQARTAQLSDDGVTAEHILRQVLDQKSDHSEAGTSLASLLIDRGRDGGSTHRARLVCVPDAEVDRLQLPR